MAADKRVAVVTGASSGIGQATASALAEAGFEVVGTSRQATRVADRRGVTFLDLDVANDDSVTAMVEEVIRRFGRIDVLVNNAGVGAAGAAEERSVNQDESVFDTNVFGVIRTMRAVLPHMRRQGAGRIINISSVFGFVPQPYMAAYVASKHAIEGYSESVDHEVREYGVRVVLVQPGGTNTPFDQNLVRADSPLPAYAERLRVFDEVMAAAMRAGDDPALVAKVIVTAATDLKPRLRYTAGPTAGRASKLRRLVPGALFDKQIRKLNRMAS